MLCLVVDLPNILLLKFCNDVDEEKNMRKCNDVFMFLMTNYIDNTRFTAELCFPNTTTKRHSGEEPGFPFSLKNEIICFL